RPDRITKAPSGAAPSVNARSPRDNIRSEHRSARRASSSRGSARRYGTSPSARGMSAVSFLIVMAREPMHDGWNGSFASAGRYCMNNTTMMGSIVIAMCVGSTTPGAVGQQMASPSQVEPAMGFDQNRTTHHFRLTPKGGRIEVHVKRASDRD